MTLRSLLAAACIHTALGAHPAKVYSQVKAAPHVPVRSSPHIHHHLFPTRLSCHVKSNPGGWLLGERVR